MPRRRYFLAVMALALWPSLALASHSTQSWGNGRITIVTNAHTSPGAVQFDAAMAAWDLADGVDLTIIDDQDACAARAKFVVCFVDAGANQPVARGVVDASPKRLKSVRIGINTYYVEANLAGTFAWDGWTQWLVCHETGHGLGLDHDQPWSQPNHDGCMSATTPVPSVHDYEELGLLYGRGSR